MSMKVKNYRCRCSTQLQQVGLIKTRKRGHKICLAILGFKQNAQSSSKTVSNKAPQKLSQTPTPNPAPDSNPNPYPAQIAAPANKPRETYLQHLEKMWEMSNTLWVQVEPPKQQLSNVKQNDFYANAGDAVRTLRDEIPILFYRDLTYDIYRDDVVFRDPRNVFHGKDNYKILFWSLRFHGRIFFKSLFVEVKRIWQLSDDTLKMQWTVRGIPRVPWKAEGRLEGYSIYKLDRNGKIYEHQVDNVIFRDPPFQRIPIFANLQWWVDYVPQRVPCPGIQCTQSSYFAFQLWLTSLLLIGCWNLTLLNSYS